MDKLLPLLLLLGAFPLVFFRAQARLCMVCNKFRNGECVEGKDNCTMEDGGGCRTRDVYLFNVRDGFYYDHTILDCSNPCKAWKLFRENLKVSSFCCKHRDFCNRYKGKLVNKYAN